MQSERHIKRLAHELMLPDHALRVIQRPKYWSPLFCSLYFDKCDELIFDNPHHGLIAAECGPELVSLTTRFSRMPESLDALHVRSYSVLGSAYRACGLFSEARDRYQRAEELVHAGSVSSGERANLLFRKAVLLCLEGELDDALVLAHESVAIYERETDALRARHLGEALSVRGLIFLKQGKRGAAMKDWSAVLGCTDPKALPRVTLCASHNLACELVKGANSHHLAVVDRHLAGANKLLTAKRRSLPRLRVLWLQGMISMRFGSERHGERIYRKAREGFIEMQAPFEMALVSLDLGRHLYRAGELGELGGLAEETHRLFSLWCQEEEPNRALLIWKETVAAHTVSAQVFATTWNVLEEHSFTRALKKS